MARRARDHGGGLIESRPNIDDRRVGLDRRAADDRKSKLFVLDTYKKCPQAVRENGAAKEEIHADRGGSGKTRKTEARAG